MICPYCNLDSRTRGGRTRDHVIPTSRGGTSQRVNLLTVCQECNGDKKNWLLTEWHAILFRRDDPRAAFVAHVIAARQAQGIREIASSEAVVELPEPATPRKRDIAKRKEAEKAAAKRALSGLSEATAVRRMRLAREMAEDGKTTDYIAWALSVSVVKVDALIHAANNCEP